MKVTLNWLKQYVDFNWSPEDLSERLTMLGLEVEGVQKLAGDFEGIVVAEVITRDKHPNADKLSVCRVNDGTGERQIVCGAQNFQAGDKVPLILPGASLPMKPGDKEPFTIKVGKIRSVESHGMMCSPTELGLPDQVDGLLILREDAKVGQPFAEYLGRAGSDVVFDLEVTPNRPDLNSVIGIAREIAAVTGNPLRLPDTGIATGPNALVGAAPGTAIDSYVVVRIEEPEICPRYTARVVTGVKVGPSPDWLRSTLEKVGIRSINNVVDVTNYVMLEVGQPLHAFDYHLIAKAADGKPTIVVRRAASEEKFKTLDNQERLLNAEMLLIADEQKGIALAGVMGGQNTEINDRTRDVLIESACFNPTNIRRTSKTLDLRSESSYRFERGADIGIAEWASRRCAQLILETAGGNLVPGAVDAIATDSESAGRAQELESAAFQRHATDYPGWHFIAVRPAKVCDHFLGVTPLDSVGNVLDEFGLKWVSSVLGSLNPKSKGDKARDWLVYAVPPEKGNLHTEQDLICEIARTRQLPNYLFLPTVPRMVTLRHHKVSALLGISLKPGEIEYYLGQLGLKAVQRQARPVGDDSPPEPVTFRIPTWRVDLKGEVDLIEEIARLHGVDKIPSTPPRGAIGAHPFDAVYDQIADVRRLLAGLGLNEAQGQTLVGNAECRMQNAEIVALANPLSADMDVLRPSLLPGLLSILRHNLSRKNPDVALFEVGRVFAQVNGQTKEERRVAIALTGQRALNFWSGDERGAKFDASDLKGIVEDVLEHFGLRGVAFTRRDTSTPLLLESATITLGGKLPLGELGQLLPTLAKKYDLRDAVFLAELRLDELLARRNPTKSLKALPPFPASRRDVAMLVPEATTHDAVLAVVKQAKPANLESVDLFDVFRGKNVPEGQKSLAYAFTYRGADKTLTDTEVNAAHDQLVADFKAKLQAALRE